MSTIMVVDDEPDVVDLVGRILGGAGHEIVGALSGKEALEKLKTVRPDLVLLDIMMPGLSGWETLELIRKQDDLSNTPVAMLTAKSLTPKTAARKDIDELVDYIEKPFTRDSLIKKVNYSIIEDLETISEQKARLRRVVDEETASTYEGIARLERLHKSILSTFKDHVDKKGLFDEDIKEAILSQQQAIQALKNKREEIERRLK